MGNTLDNVHAEHLARKLDSGRFSARHLARSELTSLITTQPTPGGGILRVSTWRQLDGPPDAADWERALAIHNYLNRSGHGSSFPQTAVPLSGQSYDLLTIPYDSWVPVEIAVDEARYEFKRVTVEDSWLALGGIDDFEVAIAAYGYDPGRLELVKLTWPAGHSGGPVFQEAMGPFKIAPPRCPACGAEMEEYRFPPGPQAAVCGSCGHEVSVPRPVTRGRMYHWGYSSPYDPRRWLVPFLLIVGRRLVTRGRSPYSHSRRSRHDRELR